MLEYRFVVVNNRSKQKAICIILLQITHVFVSRLLSGSNVVMQIINDNDVRYFVIILTTN